MTKRSRQAKITAGKAILLCAAIIISTAQGTATLQACAHGLRPALSPEEELIVGKLYYSTEDFPQAIDHFTNAIKADGQNGRLYYERGHSYYKLNQYIQAIPDYTRSLQLKYNPALNYERRAYCYLNSRQLKKGIDDCTKAIEADPLSRVGYYNRGKAYGLLGNLEGAKKDNEKVKQLDKNPRSKDLYDRCHLTQNPAERVKLCSTAVKLDPKNSEAWLLLGSSYLDMDKSKEAMACFDKLITMDENILTAYMNRGVCEMAFGKFADAVLDFDYVINRAPECYQVFYLRGQSYVAGNKIKEGQADYKHAIDLIQKKMTTEYAVKNLEYRKTLGRYLVSTYKASAESWDKAGNMSRAIDDMTCAINGSRLALYNQVQLLPMRAALYKKAGRLAEMHQDLAATKEVAAKIEAIKRGPVIAPPPVSSYTTPPVKPAQKGPSTPD